MWPNLYSQAAYKTCYRPVSIPCCKDVWPPPVQTHLVVCKLTAFPKITRTKHPAAPCSTLFLNLLRWHFWSNWSVTEISNPTSTRQTILGMEAQRHFPPTHISGIKWVWGRVLRNNIVLLSHLKKRNSSDDSPFCFSEAAAVWLQPILEEDSVQSCLLGISEMQLNHFINGLILNVNVFIATSPDYIFIINIPRS